MKFVYLACSNIFGTQTYDACLYTREYDIKEMNDLAVMQKMYHLKGNHPVLLVLNENVKLKTLPTVTTVHELA